MVLSLLQSKSVSRSQCVKAGTEEKLVLHLLHSFAMGDSSFIAVFLSTFRSFTSTRRVLEILKDRWGTGGSSSHGWGGVMVPCCVVVLYGISVPLWTKR